MLARSINLQKEFLWGFYFAEALLLIMAVLVIVQALTRHVPTSRTQSESEIVLASVQEETLFDHAQERLQNGDADGSIALLDVAIEMAATPDAEMYATRATAYNRLDNFAEAAQDYQQALTLKADNPVWHGGLCYASAQLQDFNTAIPHCDTAITLQPDNWVAWNDRCYLRAYFTGDYAGAIADCQEAIRLNPTHPYPYNNRGRAYLIMGNYTEAIADASRSLDLGNRFPALPYVTRGTAYFALGNLEQAQVDYQAALLLDPTYPELHFRLGELYRYQGQSEQARLSYCTYLELEAHPLRHAMEQATALGGCG